MIRFRPEFPRASMLCALLLGPALAIAGPVNINSADAATLARELKGIGIKRAQAIVDYRSKYGPFKSVDELALVKGIGPRAIEANRADIRVEQKATVAGATAPPAARKPQAKP